MASESGVFIHEIPTIREVNVQFCKIGLKFLLPLGEHLDSRSDSQNKSKRIDYIPAMSCTRLPAEAKCERLRQKRLRLEPGRQ